MNYNQGDAARWLNELLESNQQVNGFFWTLWSSLESLSSDFVLISVAHSWNWLHFPRRVSSTGCVRHSAQLESILTSRMKSALGESYNVFLFFCSFSLKPPKTESCLWKESKAEILMITEQFSNRRKCHYYYFTFKSVLLYAGSLEENSQINHTSSSR